MTSIPVLAGPTLGPIKGKKPEQIVIMLHGMGMDGDTFIKFADPLTHALPRARFVAPNGPWPGDGGKGYEWFHVADHDMEQVVADLGTVATTLNQMIDKELRETGLEDKNVALLGFAQGGTATLHAGLRRANPVAGILTFAAQLAAPSKLADEITARPPVYLVQGDRDPQLSSENLLNMVEALMHANVDVSSHVAQNCGHDINADGAKSGTKFLTNVFDLPLPLKSNPDKGGMLQRVRNLLSR